MVPSGITFVSDAPTVVALGIAFQKLEIALIKSEEDFEMEYILSSFPLRLINGHRVSEFDQKLMTNNLNWMIGIFSKNRDSKNGNLNSLLVTSEDLTNGNVFLIWTT
ncbi:hypothetical protein L596_024511 [Steinernema carpocapsae]|uniref:Uncharacterized protein n=1 Tax=Steinernema carpocapsae TaxID=34508 RepID=A0A4U5MGY2_STECR|nr:hypothetical protein L596_024511 [Steinernema carpocapsae]